MVKMMRAGFFFSSYLPHKFSVFVFWGRHNRVPQLKGLTQRKPFSPNSGVQKAEIKLGPFKPCGGICSVPFSQLPWLSGHLWCSLTCKCVAPCLCLHTTFSPCVCLSLYPNFSSIRTWWYQLRPAPVTSS